MDTPQAKPLQTSRSVSVQMERVEASLTTVDIASCPENRTTLELWSLTWAKAMAIRPTSKAAAGVRRNARLATTCRVARASSMMTWITSAATRASAIIQMKSVSFGSG